MKQNGQKRRSVLRAAAVTLGIAGALWGGVLPSHAQNNGIPDVALGQVRGINAARDVRWDQKLDGTVDLTTAFRDESGKEEPLGSFIHNRPAIVVMPFYKCPGQCTTELNNMTDTLKDEKFKFRVGRDFDIIVVSIDPKEGAALSTAKKKEYLDVLGQPGAASGWHFLTGREANIKKLADEIGFRYKYDLKTDQYAHPTGLTVLTPKGKLSRYLLGAVYSPKDMRLALTEAGQGRIGTVADQFVLACYHYDPQTGTYGPAVFKIIQVMCFATVAVVGGFMLLSFRKDVGEKRLTPEDARAMRAAAARETSEQKGDV